MFEILLCHWLKARDFQVVPFFWYEIIIMQSLLFHPFFWYEIIFIMIIFIMQSLLFITFKFLLAPVIIFHPFFWYEPLAPVETKKKLRTT